MAVLPVLRECDRIDINLRLLQTQQDLESDKGTISIHQMEMIPKRHLPHWQFPYQNLHTCNQQYECPDFLQKQSQKYRQATQSRFLQ